MSGWNSSRRVCISPLLKASYPRRIRSSLGCPMVAPLAPAVQDAADHSKRGSSQQELSGRSLLDFLMVGRSWVGVVRVDENTLALKGAEQPEQLRGGECPEAGSGGVLVQLGQVPAHVADGLVLAAGAERSAPLAAVGGHASTSSDRPEALDDLGVVGAFELAGPAEIPARGDAGAAVGAARLPAPVPAARAVARVGRGVGHGASWPGWGRSMAGGWWPLPAAAWRARSSRSSA